MDISPYRTIDNRTTVSVKVYSNDIKILITCCIISALIKIIKIIDYHAIQNELLLVTLLWSDFIISLIGVIFSCYRCKKKNNSYLHSYVFINLMISSFQLIVLKFNNKYNYQSDVLITACTVALFVVSSCAICTLTKDETIDVVENNEDNDIDDTETVIDEENIISDEELIDGTLYVPQ
jgi:ABC-type transport system involved in cytochrome c biogenesis permease component